MNKISELYMLHKEMDEIYENIQKDYGIPDAEYWCLVAVRTGIGYYQHEICSAMSVSKQTVNSALKQLEKKNLIKLVVEDSNHRKKKIELTIEGIEFSERYIDPVTHIEDNAWDGLEKEEQDELFRITRKLNKFLEVEVEAYLQKKKNI